MATFVCASSHGQRTHSARPKYLSTLFEGHTDKGKLFIKSNKNTIVVKTQLHLNMRFPIDSWDYLIHRLNEKKNNDLIRTNLLTDTQPDNLNNTQPQPDNLNNTQPQPEATVNPP